MENKNVRRRRKQRKPIWPAIVIVCVLILVAVLMIQGSKDLTIELEKDQIVLEYGDKLAFPAMKVLLGDEVVETEIQVDEPKMDKLGDYTVTYTATYGRRTATATLKVKLVDTTAPVLTLNFKSDSVTLPGQQYVEEGYSAFDAYDGDLTTKVQRMVVDGVVYYKVADSSGNVAETKRPIVYADVVAPELMLFGDDTVVITLGQKFNDPGWKAIDEMDGDLTEEVQVHKDYDTNVPGVYTITYKVSDAAGNVTSVTRTLIVKEASGDIPVVNPGEKVIYLTFDDGPSQFTPELLKILAKYDVKATFFVVGTMQLEYLDDIAAAGHSIGLHSDTHDFESVYASDEAYMRDLQAIREKVYQYTGIYSNLVRFPGGSSNTISKKLCQGIMTRMTERLTQMGYRIYDWNVDSGDASGLKDPDSIAEKVITGIQMRPVSVVLQHDIRDYSVAAVEQIIQWGLANGYRFLALDETSPICQHTIVN